MHSTYTGGRVSPAPFRSAFSWLIVAMLSVLACASMLVSPPALAVDYPSLTICGGAEGGKYDRIARTIKTNILVATAGKWAVNIANTGGTMDNKERFARNMDERVPYGESAFTCDVAVVQYDSLGSAPYLPPGTTNYAGSSESAMWIYRRGGDVDDFGDMESGSNVKKYSVAVVSGSGGEITLNALVTADDDYGDIKRLQFNTLEEAVDAVAAGSVLTDGQPVRIAGMVYTGNPMMLPTAITDMRQNLQIGYMNDMDFGNIQSPFGDKVYVPISLKKGEAQLDLTGSSASVLKTRSVIVINQVTMATAGKHAAAILRRAIIGAGSGM